MKLINETVGDPVGLQVLDVLSNAEEFNQWMFSIITPWCCGKIMEIGSGIGNISKFFLQQNHPIFLSDVHSAYCNYLVRRFHSYPHLLGVEQIDLAATDFAGHYSHLKNSFDTVFALNVMEHIKNDNQFISNCRQLLKARGTLILLVPAFPGLYCRFDSELGHYRRYSRKTLKLLFKENGFSINSLFYFNAAGILGWLIFGKFFSGRRIRQTQMRVYNQLMPVIKRIDGIFCRRVGLSLIITGRKDE